MNHAPDELPANARAAFESYPQLAPSNNFNRAVLESLAQERARRKRGLIGQIEEFLGLGLWSFAASGALGAFLPAAVLVALLLSGTHPPKPSNPDVPTSLLGWGPFDLRRGREYLQV